MELETFYYRFNQNNSGGVFETDKYLCAEVLIEAYNSEQANLIAENIGIYFDGCESDIDCECCGDRWDRVDDFDKIDLKEFDNIEQYAKENIGSIKWTNPPIKIHKLNGLIIDINKL